MVHKKIPIELYNQVVHVIICQDCEKEKHKLPQLDIDNWNFGGYSIRVETDHYILLNKKYGKDYLLSTAVHEAFHVSNFIMKQVGIHPDVNNDEAQAYLLTYIFEQILKTINNKQD